MSSSQQKYSCEVSDERDPSTPLQKTQKTKTETVPGLLNNNHCLQLTLISDLPLKEKTRQECFPTELGRVHHLVIIHFYPGHCIHRNKRGSLESVLMNEPFTEKGLLAPLHHDVLDSIFS